MEKRVQVTSSPPPPFRHDGRRRTDVREANKSHPVLAGVDQSDGVLGLAEYRVPDYGHKVIGCTRFWPLLIREIEGTDGRTDTRPLGSAGRGFCRLVSQELEL